MHSFILGQTGWGKTTLATSLVNGYHAAGIKVIVLDPLVAFGAGPTALLAVAWRIGMIKRAPAGGLPVDLP